MKLKNLIKQGWRSLPEKLQTILEAGACILVLALVTGAFGQLTTHEFLKIYPEYGFGVGAGFAAILASLFIIAAVYISRK